LHRFFLPDVPRFTTTQGESDDRARSSGLRGEIGTRAQYFDVQNLRTAAVMRAELQVASARNTRRGRRNTSRRWRAFSRVTVSRLSPERFPQDSPISKSAKSNHWSQHEADRHKNCDQNQQDAPGGETHIALDSSTLASHIVSQEQMLQSRHEDAILLRFIEGAHWFAIVTGS